MAPLRQDADCVAVRRYSRCTGPAAAQKAHPPKGGLVHYYRALGVIHRVSSNSFNIVRKMIVPEGHVYLTVTVLRAGWADCPEQSSPFSHHPVASTWLPPGHRGDAGGLGPEGQGRPMQGQAASLCGAPHTSLPRVSPQALQTLLCRTFPNAAS